MEDDRINTPNSGETKPEILSLPSSEFEFGSLTPSSPSQDPFLDHSPADHLFLNGRLLPHSFPTSTRSVSRTTSENTFRSNSTSSRSSDSSSPTSYTTTPRTSTCNVFKITSSRTNITCFGPRSEKIMSQRSGTFSHNLQKPTTNNGKISYLPTQCKRKNKATEIVTAQLYGSYSRRWQHITPVFQREGSVKSSNGGFKVGGRKKKTVRRKKKVEERRGSKFMKWWKSIFKAVVLACRECHAMEPQRLVNE
ncbi:hypothetical protein AALP_AA4G030700 [Arabis alpina]|uniref:Uncharacterized protein n=1 Tax=Arabis alpina TaxID=50452 RepID=A0A087H0U0_ARAAL|nr:hypothetical protein AALP_AA4G030700 [Arabis alpina]